MNVTIAGPNLPRNNHGTFHVHKTGCADLRKRFYAAGERPWAMAATSQKEVVTGIYPEGDFCYDADNEGEYAPYRDDVTFFPCTDGLPE